MSQTSLKSLGLPAAADAVEDYVKERGLPVLASVGSLPVQASPAQPERPKPAPITKMAIEVPDYLPAKLRRLALERDCTIRHIVLEALHSAGCEIKPEDRLKDGRRQQKVAD